MNIKVNNYYAIIIIMIKKRYKLVGGAIDMYKPKRIGVWYRHDYISQVEELLSNIEVSGSNNQKNSSACIVPHAGLSYSGRVAAQVYSKIEFKNYNNILLLCTLHRLTNKLYIPNFKKIVYPNQNDIVDVNIEWRDILTKSEMFTLNSEEFDYEHSFEMQLPFIIKLANQGTRILPMLVGNPNNLEQASNYILNTMPPDTLIIVTTDFTHYGPRFNYVVNAENVREYIRKKDMKDVDAILDNKMEEFIGKSVCGRYAVKMLMYMMNTLKLFSELTSYETSNDNKNDENSVSYAGIIYYDRLQHYETWKTIINTHINKNERINIYQLANYNLLNIPRLTLMILDKIYDESKFYISSTNQKLEEIRKHINIDKSLIIKGVFVTLEENKMLQGCIGIFYEGSVRSKLSLIELIIKYTLATIFDDSRFPNSPLRMKTNYKNLYESTRYSFKINFLDGQKLINNEKFWNEYVPCTHGITLEMIMNDKTSRATFLPLVMVEQGWLPNRLLERSKCRELDLSNEEKKYFEEQTFGSLTRKMGFSNMNKDWRQGNVYLYKSYEYDDSVASDYRKVNEQK